jgi:hypothetical protein
MVSESEPLRSSHPGSIGGVPSRVEFQIGAANRVAKHWRLPAPGAAIEQVALQVER